MDKDFEFVTRTHSQYVRTLPLNDQYRYTIEYQGKRYFYDPDYDCWTREYTEEDWANMSHWDRFGWIWVILVLTVLALGLTYWKNGTIV